MSYNGGANPTDSGANSNNNNSSSGPQSLRDAHNSHQQVVAQNGARTRSPRPYRHVSQNSNGPSRGGNRGRVATMSFGPSTTTNAPHTNSGNVYSSNNNSSGNWRYNNNPPPRSGGNNNNNNNNSNNGTDFRPTEAAEDIYVPQPPVQLPPPPPRHPNNNDDDDTANNNNNNNGRSPGGRDSALAPNLPMRESPNPYDVYTRSSFDERDIYAYPRAFDNLEDNSNNRNSNRNNNRQQPHSNDSSTRNSADTFHPQQPSRAVPQMSVLPMPPPRPTDQNNSNNRNSGGGGGYDPFSMNFNSGGFNVNLQFGGGRGRGRGGHHNSHHHDANPHLSTVLPDDIESDVRRARNAGVDAAFIEQLRSMSPRTRTVILTDIEDQRRSTHGRDGVGTREFLQRQQQQRQQQQQNSNRSPNSRTPPQQHRSPTSVNNSSFGSRGSANEDSSNGGSYRMSPPHHHTQGGRVRQNHQHRFPAADSSDDDAAAIAAVRAATRNTNNGNRGGGDDDPHFAGATRAQREGNFLIDMIQHITNGGQVPDETHAMIIQALQAFGVRGLPDLHANDPWNAVIDDDDDDHHHHDDDDDEHTDDDGVPAARPRRAHGHQNPAHNFRDVNRLAREQQRLLQGQDIDSMSYEQLQALCDRMGHVNTGLSQSQINHVTEPYSAPAVTNNSNASSGGGDSVIDVDADSARPSRATVGGEEERCSICLDPLSAQPAVRTIVCNHLYHRECLAHWLKLHPTCPVCTMDLTPPAGRK